ncbi:MAG: substrate-binding protein [Pseudomonadota bacterium]
MLFRRRNVLRTGLAAGLAASFAPSLRAQSDAIKVGAVLPFSGGLELFGEQAKLGIDLAVAEINAAGGVLGQPMEVLYEDNRTDPKTSVEVMQKLVRGDDVIAVTGPITSNARDAMASQIARLQRPLLYATNYEGGACDPFIFCFNTVPNQELQRLIPYLIANKGTSFYMFGADYVWPQKMFEFAERQIADLGGTVAGKEFTPWGVKEFTPVIRRMAESEAEVLLFALPGADGITFVRQAEDLGLLEQLTVGFLGFSEAYLGAFGDGKAQDMYVAVPLVASSDAPSVQDFVARVRANAGNEATVSHYVLTHYNAIRALAQGLEAAGEISPEAAATGMAGLEVDSPTGPVTIGEADHHVTLSMFLARTEGAGLVTVEDIGEIAPEAGCA